MKLNFYHIGPASHIPPSSSTPGMARNSRKSPIKKTSSAKIHPRALSYLLCRAQGEGATFHIAFHVRRCGREGEGGDKKHIFYRYGKIVLKILPSHFNSFQKEGAKNQIQFSSFIRNNGLSNGFMLHVNLLNLLLNQTNTRTLHHSLLLFSNHIEDAFPLYLAAS